MQTKQQTKVALITGAARRIGAEIARTLHAAGMNIVIHYNTSAADAKQLCEKLNKKRENSSITLQAELNEFDNAKKLIMQAIDSWGRLDVLVNNASRFFATPITGDIPQSAWDELINTNLRAPFYLAQAAAAFLADTHGSIINITDIHAKYPLRDYAVYCMAKSGLLMMTKALAKELGPKVRVNAVAPGAIMWPEGENSLNDGTKQKIIASTALLRHGLPQHIAKAVLFFVQDADYATGQVLNIDGGRMLCL